MTKKPQAAEAKTIDEAVAESQASSAANEATAVQADETKVGKVEARLAALEAYVKHNVKTLGWPEFKG